MRRKTNGCVMNRIIEEYGGKPESLADTTMRKLTFFAHHAGRDGMTKMLMQGKCEGRPSRRKSRRK